MDVADNKLLIGITGSGKTEKVKNLTADCDRVLFFDTQGRDYKDGVMFYELTELKKFWLQHYQGSFRMIYRPLNPKGDIDEVCDLVYKCGNMTIVIEEVDVFAEDNKRCIGINLIARRGRKKDIHFIACTQRPHGIDHVITSQATETYVFAVTEPIDVSYLKSKLGVGILEHMVSLKKYHWILKRNDSTEYEVGIDEI